MTYEEWLARQPKLEPMVRCVELSHPSWPEPLRIALDDANGTTVTELSAVGFYPFAPFSETQKNIGTSLDTGFDCQFGGYNKETLELFNGTDFTQQEWIDYRSMKFNSTDTSYIMEDNQLRIFSMELVHDKSTQFAGFEAVPPRSKYNQTGESYNLTDVPMLEAFI